MLCVLNRQSQSASSNSPFSTSLLNNTDFRFPFPVVSQGVSHFIAQLLLSSFTLCEEREVFGVGSIPVHKYREMYSISMSCCNSSLLSVYQNIAL